VTVEALRPQNLSRLLELGFEQRPEAGVVRDVAKVDGRTYRVSAHGPGMGTRVGITVLCDAPSRADDAMGRAFAEMDRLIGIFSRFQSDSALSCLNEAGRLRGPPPELVQVVSRALDYFRITRGVFDISVAPVVDLFRTRLAGSAPRAPSDLEVVDALRRVGAAGISASRRELRFGRDGMGITVDGIAKGFIVDRMARALERRRVRRYLIDAGGDIRAAGRKEDDQPWTVGVRDPWTADHHPDRIHLMAGAVATSGGYERFFDRDGLQHHIVRADSGRSPTESASVSVLAPTGMAADALATGLFLLPPAEALALTETLAGCECLIIDRDGRLFRSRGWRSVAPPTSGKGTNDGNE
jgi:FAD:protein FMN transferase